MSPVNPMPMPPLPDDVPGDTLLPSAPQGLGATVAVDVRSIFTIRTAENLEIEVELAGVGNRVFAFLLDAAMMGVLSVFMMVAAAYSYQIDPDLPMVIFTAGGFLIFYGYHFVQEWLWSGKTLGKYLLGIRVLRNNGQPIGLWESMGRNLFRIVDVLVSGVGLLPMLLSPSEKRFGDFVVGTIVVNDQRLERPPVAGVALNAEGLPLERPEGLDEALLDLGKRLSAEEYDIIQDALTRNPAMKAGEKQALFEALAAYFIQRLHLTAAQWGDDGQDGQNRLQQTQQALTALYFGYRC